MNVPFIVLFLSLDAAVVSAPAASAPPAVESPVAVERVVLHVDHGPLLERQKAAAAEKSGFFVKDDATRALRERHHVDVVEDANAPSILVELAWKDYENSVYRISVSTRRPKEAPVLVEAFEATCINNTKLVEAVLARLPEALEQLAQPQGPADLEVGEPERKPEASEPAVQPEPDPVVSDTEGKVAPLGAVGIVGIVAGVGGLGMAGFGISRLAKGETRMTDPDREQLGIASDVRPQGRAWLGVGVGVAAVGATMLVIDLTVLRKRRARSVAVVPALGRGTAGIDVRGRF